MRYYLSMVDEFVILTSPSFLDKNFFTININETIKKLHTFHQRIHF